MSRRGARSCREAAGLDDRGMRPKPASPFASVDPDDEARVVAAKAGDMNALDALVRRHQPWVFNLALRMVWRREAAEDATQEIFLKAVTHLGSFEGRSQFSTWLHRIAVNHLLNVRKSEMEAQSMTFDDMGRSLDSCVDSELPDESVLPVDHGLLVEEAKLGCITAMLMCLDRRQRLAFILGEIFGVTSEQGGEAMEILAENFRQLLTRARRDLYQFMQGKCGLVNALNPCRCSKKAGAFMANGWLDPAKRQFTRERLAAVQDVTPHRLDELAEMERAHAEHYRSAPLSDGPDFSAKLRAVVARSGFAKE
ncbi:RNA polymerase subunit sigma-70 [Nibricoccus aquaticus]|uniref:RNA polymerase subunit sigma-70 n=2 Tax=Nibricoccus aquaticus TaxID=2576891 RepID=A0A290QA85_9BACT|nr:RNA polymerase subunit sigma-70 [Nibricoccus aquaticus]